MSNNDIKKQFPILSATKNKNLVYLDNTATSQKPLSVINKMNEFMREENATVHRGIYGLSQEATIACDNVRKNVANLINATSENEIIFTKSATESINLVSMTLGSSIINEGDEILITEMEHHANIVPWQRLCEQKKATLIVCPITDEGEIDKTEFKKKLSEKTKIVALIHISNVLGTINPVKELCDLVKKESNAYILIDGSQAIAHMQVNVQDIGCDFYCFSGHKMYGPTGIGVLYGKYDILDKMPPFLTGGDMIESVTFAKTTFAKPPLKFEAGTPAVIEIIGLGEAIKFIESLGYEKIQTIEKELYDYAKEKLSQIIDLKIIGNATKKEPIFSFLIGNVHPHDVGTILDSVGIAVRVGQHCAQPLMERYKIPATVRASFCIYNTKEDIDKLVEGIKKVKDVFI